MNNAGKKAGLVLVLIALVAGAAVGGWYLYRWWKRPDFRKLGGTVLIYELDMHTLLPGKVIAGAYVSAVEPGQNKRPVLLKPVPLSERTVGPME